MTEEEREAHVVRLLPAVYGIARRVARICRLRETDDLVGDGSVGLVRAVDSFDPNRGVSLDCYVRHVILGTMLNGMRRRDPVS
ncbi:MAG: RNA polymerase subunit sigma-28, partial [Candidatus Eremiobacteraeota bacterium]|nr:RNA polymerase subunit sigma-28 [Candidatus Eremiobacteraeota bacterium]